MVFVNGGTGVFETVPFFSLGFVSTLIAKVPSCCFIPFHDLQCIGERWKQDENTKVVLFAS